MRKSDMDERGDYFTLKRYFTMLVLYNPDKESIIESGSEADAITAETVGAALLSLAFDLDAVLVDNRGATVAFQEKVTVEPSELVPAMCCHLASQRTANRAVCALSSLLRLGNMVGEEAFIRAVYKYEAPASDGKGASNALDAVLSLLE